MNVAKGLKIAGASAVVAVTLAAALYALIMWEGSSVPYHTHPGDEAGYVVRGTLILKTRGQPDRILNAGDSFFNPRGAVHSLAAVSSDGAAASAWIIDKGAPLATPAP